MFFLNNERKFKKYIELEERVKKKLTDINNHLITN